MIIISTLAGVFFGAMGVMLVLAGVANGWIWQLIIGTISFGLATTCLYPFWRWGVYEADIELHDE